MSRKKHTHQTKAEAHADEAAVAATVAETSQSSGDAKSAPFERADVAKGRLHKLVKTAEELAKTRLSGTRVELLIDGLPERLEKALDAALDRFGLVRKSKVPGARKADTAAPATPGAEPAPAE